MMKAEEIQWKHLNVSNNRGPFEKLPYSFNTPASLSIKSGAFLHQIENEVQVKYDLVENSLKSAS